MSEEVSDIQISEVDHQEVVHEQPASLIEEQ